MLLAQLVKRLGELMYPGADPPDFAILDGAGGAAGAETTQCKIRPGECGGEVEGPAGFDPGCDEDAVN